MLLQDLRNHTYIKYQSSQNNWTSQILNGNKVSEINILLKVLENQNSIIKVISA